MSWNPAFDPGPLTVDPATIDTVIVPRTRDLGGFEVRRALPAAGRRMVGPFVFFDQMGPAEFITGQGIDVRPHPHIGLGTVTYLLNGHFIHKDSLGTDQKIVPGEVNWMIAGRGITHSERTDPVVREGTHGLFGVQTWLAQYLRASWADFYNPSMYRDAGIPDAFNVRAAIMAHPSSARLREAASAKLVRLFVDAGLLAEAPAL